MGMAERGSGRARLRDWLSPYVHLSNNALSLIGVVLVTSAGILWLFLLPASFGAAAANPYLNILTVMILPAAFFGGLILIPLGLFLKLRRDRKAGRGEGPFPALTWGSLAARRLALFLLITTVANLIIGGHLSYTSVHYMDSVQFCGTTCHTVMQPEYTAYQNSPHSRVACVQCHIGPGASWAVKSKIDGLRQVWAVMWNSYERPIPTPVRELRPARETCETCHWPQKFAPNRLRIINKFGDDEKSTRTRTVLLMHLGGGMSGPLTHKGIHGAHLGPGITIRYAHADEARQKITRIAYENKASGRSVEYAPSDQSQAKAASMRVMDCMDCHNRPSHTFELPERAVDQALSDGRLDPSLPFVKKRVVEVLRKKYASDAEAAVEIPKAIRAFYPGMSSADQASATAIAIWRRNVFPQMNVTWGAYPNNIGHTDFPGCFRCHEDTKVNVADGKTAMTQDCNTCHQLLAMEEEQPKVLSDLGLEAAPQTTSAAAATGGQ